MTIKQFKNLLLSSLGITGAKREQNRTPRVLFYHGVANVENDFIQGLHIRPDAFRQQLAYLQKHYEVISLDDYYTRWRNATFTGRETVLTFDDGYRNNLDILAPILREYSLPFTVFISTHHIDTGQRFSTFIGRAVFMDKSLSSVRIPCIEFDARLTTDRQRKQLFKEISWKIKHSDIKTVQLITEQLTGNLPKNSYQALCDRYPSDALMNWDEVRQLQKEYNCTIGSHCLDHFICGTFQDEPEIKRQITESKAVIEQQLNTPCFYLAYPNGDSCPFAEQAAEQAGYRMAFTTQNQRVEKVPTPFALPRYGVNFHYCTFVTDLAFKPR